MRKSCNLYGEQTALICDKKVTYNELKTFAQNIAQELKKIKVQEGEHILLAMDNSIEFAIGFFGINLVGATVIPVYMKSGINKLKGIIEFYEINTILALPKYKKLFDEMLEENKSLQLKILYVEKQENELHIEHAGIRLKEVAVNPKKPAIILFSSGTTNMPKGIMLSNENIESNVKAISDYLALSNVDQILLIKNINHASSITGELLVGLANGCTLHMMTGILTASRTLKVLEEEKISVLFGVPTLLNAMMGERNFETYDLDALRIINFYGASMAIAKIRELALKFPNTNLIYSYGLTEAAPRVTYIMREQLLTREGSSGIPIEGTTVKIMNENQEALPLEIGEICVKGPNVMQGYYKNELQTQKVLKDDYLHTGDLGYKDKDGYLYVTGRRDNLIIKTGKNVYPEEIEGVLLGFKGIKEVLVRGEEDELLGQDIVAYVVGLEGVQIKLIDVLKHCKKELEDYKIPGKIYQVEALQKTISGKIIRKQNINLGVE
ncbi:class I adenylate-forming enzyme family protein [Cellulosilyticum ruminicola]|uniref:class I adenylate-forming enzyme family protein n=1 Tax=Cellulosilyticum ruminicola TaxID=425254 RepID=UPI0009F89EA7|nr:class I adenylate-forming enzyme family protein [Cellulosilyticum ruminicola]